MMAKTIALAGSQRCTANAQDPRPAAPDHAYITQLLHTHPSCTAAGFVCFVRECVEISAVTADSFEVHRALQLCLPCCPGHCVALLPPLFPGPSAPRLAQSDTSDAALSRFSA